MPVPGGHRRSGVLKVANGRETMTYDLPAGLQPRDFALWHASCDLSWPSLGKSPILPAEFFLKF
jgi:hypothetical protein